MFNDDQRAHMADLAKIPPVQRCYCGWYRVGECPNCPPRQTCADKLALRCPECQNYPPASQPDAPIVHNIKCSHST